MRLHRFITEIDRTLDQLVVQDARLCHQLSRVLRLSVGDELLLCDGRGFEARVCLDGVTPREIRATVRERREIVPADVSVTLYLAILKGDHMDLVAEKATEVGIARLVPVETQRTIKKAIRADRIQTIMKEATEQCGRGTVPVLEEKMTFKQALASLSKEGTNLFFDIGGEGMNTALAQGLNDRSLFIGPEGGWTDAERDMAQAAGCTVVSLGTSILRAETAAIVAAYMVSTIPNPAG